MAWQRCHQFVHFWRDGAHAGNAVDQNGEKHNQHGDGYARPVGRGNPDGQQGRDGDHGDRLRGDQVRGQQALGQGRFGQHIAEWDGDQQA